MNRAVAVAFGALAAFACAHELRLDGVEENSLLSRAHYEKIEAATKAANPLVVLEKLHREAATAEEKADLELTIARYYNQRSGYVDSAKAIEWYDKALVRTLPPLTAIEQFMLRGNSHETLDHPREALADYIRGLLLILRFDLPAEYPSDRSGKLHPPGNYSGFPPLPAAQHLAEQRQRADHRRDFSATREEQDLIRRRWFYVEAIKRMVKAQKLTEAQLREAVEPLTNRPDRTATILRLAREPNPRPWP